MVTQVQSAGWGYRLGRAARCALRGYSHSEKQMAGWLASNGLPVTLALGVVWAIRLAVVGVLLYLAFWLAVVMAGLVLAAAWATDEPASAEKDCWPLMSEEELRASMFYDPVLHNDVSHEQFKDD